MHTYTRSAPTYINIVHTELYIYTPTTTSSHGSVDPWMVRGLSMGHTLPTRIRWGPSPPPSSLPPPPPRLRKHARALTRSLRPRTTITRDDDAYTRNYSEVHHTRYFFLASSAFFSLSRANDSPEEGEKIARRVTTSALPRSCVRFLHSPEGRVRCSGKDFLEGDVRKSSRSRSRMRNKARRAMMACHVSSITPSSVSR